MERGSPKNGPFCQSCGMPLEKQEDFGTNADGSKSTDYCHFCFQSGKLARPDITIEQMIDQLAGIIATQMNIPEVRAKEKARMLIERKSW